ncbi:MAG: AAA family ATPase [Candidatus Absconditabacterales bacterium]
MQLTNIKVSNLLSYPYQPDLSKTQGVLFYNRKNNNVNVLIGPNGAGKSGFLRIIKQILKVGLMNDYIYDKNSISSSKHTNQTIQPTEQWIEGIHKHFKFLDKDSQVIIHFTLTQHDYDNMQYIAKNTEILNMLIKKYSTLNFEYPIFSNEQIHNIPNSFILECSFDIDAKKIHIDEQKLSPQEQFVLLYLRTIELVQICVNIYNEFERKDKEEPLFHLKNGIGFIGMNRSLKKVSNIIDPYAWNTLIGDKMLSDYHSYLGFYLCARKIRNIISDHSTLKMNPDDIQNYPKKLKQSEFYISLALVIKKYFNKTLTVEYINGLLNFMLIDQFGQNISFTEMSDGEQSLLSMIFTMYGYDFNHGMVIIDEPEIHFHPQMQRSFSRMIEKINQNIGTQFILSTYSPLFINESNIGNVYRFSKINGETKIKNPFFTLSADEATLVHLLKFENLSKIFFVNKIIMVEGETDAYFFEFYLKYLHTLPQRNNKITDYEIININGKGSNKIRSKFLARFGLQGFFIGDWDNIVDYGFMTQLDLVYYYKQARTHYSGLKKSGKTHRHYNKLIDTLRNIFPKIYKNIMSNIDSLYKKDTFILKKGDIETYLGMQEKGLENTVKFCHYEFKNRLENKNFDSCRQEFDDIFSAIFAPKKKS